MAVSCGTCTAGSLQPEQRVWPPSRRTLFAQAIIDERWFGTNAVRHPDNCGGTIRAACAAGFRLRDNNTCQGHPHRAANQCGLVASGCTTSWIARTTAWAARRATPSKARAARRRRALKRRPRVARAWTMAATAPWHVRRAPARRSVTPKPRRAVPRSSAPTTTRACAARFPTAAVASSTAGTRARPDTSATRRR
jgi:hypothetical protein